MLYNPNMMNWVNPNIQYLFDTEYYEYDIKNAGWSISKEYHLLPDSVLDEINKLPKDKRNVRMGLERRDNKAYSKLLTEKFAEVRRFFIQFNDISDSDLICVRNDAIFTIGTQKKLKFGRIEFRPKHSYHAYIRLKNRLEIMIGNDIEVSGMNQSGINAHRLYLLDFIERIVSLIERRDKFAIRHIMKFIDQFKHLELDDEYYLEFTPHPKEMNPMQVYTTVIIPLLQIAVRECL